MAVAPEGNVVAAANELITIIRTALDPCSSNEQRAQAYRAHEEFKVNSQLCCQVGLYIAEQEHSLDMSLRLCGLQLVEWYILHKWDKVDATWHQEIKLKCLRFIETANFQENKCIKEATVKIFVEVVKRTWPQEWTTLFSDLSSLHVRGDGQLELVLIILMRLSEDINPLNGLDEKVKPQRRKDMVTTLNNEIPELLRFLVTTIHERTMQLQQQGGFTATQEDTASHLHIITSSLHTITELAAWIKFEFLLSEDRMLFKTLFCLLEFDEMKFNASHCLCTIFDRKSNAEKRLDVMIILSDDALDIIEKVARKCAGKAAAGDEDEYNFLKKLTRTITTFGSNQIANLWGNDRGFSTRPECFGRFLKLMMDLTKHESVVVLNDALKTWQVFCQHPDIAKDEVFIDAVGHLPPYLLKCANMKVANPQSPDNPGAIYSIIDFDELGEFKTACSDIRQKLNIIIPRMIDSHLQVLLNFVDETQEETFKAGPDLKGPSDSELLSSSHYMAFESFLFFSKVVFTALLQKRHIGDQGVAHANNFLQRLLDCPFQHPTYAKQLIVAFEGMIPLFVHSRQLLCPTILKVTTYLHAPNADYEEIPQRRLKTEGVLCLSRMMRRKPEVMVDMFDDLHTFFNMKVRENIFSNPDKALLIEGLVCVSKHLQEKDKMKSFVEEVFRYPLSIFNRDDVKEAISDTSKFICFLSLDECNIAEPAIQRKHDLFSALWTLYAALKALCCDEKVNDNPTVDDINASALRYPGFQLLVDSLPHLFDVACQACLLWTKVDTLSPLFKRSLEPHFTELYLPSDVKRGETQTSGAESDGDGEEGGTKPNNDRQWCVCMLHDVTFRTIKMYGESLGPVFFSLPGMIDVFIEKVVINWVHLPNNRLRFIWKTLVNGVCQRCPAKYYDSVLGPFLSVAIEQVFDRLTSEWRRLDELEITQQSTKKEDEEEENDQSPEIIDRRLMFALSKDIFTVLVGLMRLKRTTEPALPKGQEVTLGPLGEFLLRYPGTCLKVIALLFSAFTWPDSTILAQVASIVGPIVTRLFLNNSSPPPEPDLPNQLILQLLKGLQRHGGDQAIASNMITVLFTMYARLREKYPNIVHVLMMVPTCSEDELKNFDLMMFVEENGFNDATKRKRFRKLVEGAIGKTVSEMHKTDLKINDLVPLAPRAKPKPVEVLGEADDAGLCRLFSPNEDNGVIC